ncbi:hypothetical protein MVEN_01691500 [Mycena venus]|uniref:Mixed lineage kinase domain-containing protein n=1 Tax=Mycena venus TaxID=2733690 RepID=A0A8H7CQ03_9AGAR|nr:hypothetical protein MVEN_01691500 [Mycena venus]
MPQSHILPDIRVENVTNSLRFAAVLLGDMHDGFGTPFLQAILNTTLSLITAVQNVKRNKDQCIRLLENIHQLIYAIADLHVSSDTIGELTPTALNHIGQLTETLHKIHTYIEAQQEGNKIKQLFRQSEMNSLLKDCQIGLQQAMALFKIQINSSIFDNIDEMRRKTEDMQKGLLESILSLADDTASARSYLTLQHYNLSRTR